MKKILFVFSIFLLLNTHLKLSAQTTQDYSKYPYWIRMMQDEKVNFYEVQKAFYGYYPNKEKHEKLDRKEEENESYEIFKRWEYITSRRINPDGSRIPADQILNEYQQYLINKKQGETQGSQPANLTGNWTSLGPETLPISRTGYAVSGLGRINCVAFHPKTASTIYVGAPCGGLWKTTNGGTSWSSNTDGLPTLGVSSIAIDPIDDDTIYIGTGDKDATDAAGLGVMKTTDGGSNWSSSNSGMGNVTVNRLLINPSNHAILIAATSAGIYRSTNYGASWTKTSSNSNYYDDVQFKPKHPNTAYATENSKFYRSTDGGATWTNITSGIGTGGYRAVIGVTPADTNYVYFVIANTYSYKGTYLSTNGGTSFSTKSTTPNLMEYSDNGSGTGGQGFYDLDVAVDTANKAIVYVGGVNVFKSTNSGVNWTINAHWTGSGVPIIHADQHAFGINPHNNRLYACTDGGIYYTANGGTTWTDLNNGINIGQVYKIGQSATRQDLLIGGFQDNATSILDNGHWYNVIGGDGMECIIDRKDTNYQYGEIYYGDIYRTTNAGVTFTKQIAGNGVGGINEGGDWVTPYIQHRTNTKIMYVGYNNLWRCTNVKATNPSWTKISNSLGGSNTKYIEVVEQSAADTNVLYMSRSDNKLFLTNNIHATTPTWTDLTSTLPNSGSLPVDVKTHPIYPNVVYMIQNFKVYVSTNKGSSWTNITGTLPNVPKNTLVLDKNANSGIYIGTDAGVYYRDSTMSDWTLFNTGLPAAGRTFELEIYYDAANSANNLIKAATFGRGIWQSPLYNPVVPPVADFNANTTSVCPGTTINFTDATTNSPTTWSWVTTPNKGLTYMNSSSSTSQNPQIKFDSSGTYTVALTASKSGASDTKTKTNYITIKSNPTLGVSATKNSFAIGDSSQITATGAASYSWSPTTGLRPDTGAVIWAKPSVTTTYTVTGTSTGGCTSTKDITLTVTNSYSAGITSIDSPKNSSCIGKGRVAVTLKNFSLANLTSTTIDWKVNGVSQTTYNWTGNLPKNASVSLYLGNYSFLPSTTYNLVAWTSQPNGYNDIDKSNDTAKATISGLLGGMSGTYTIGGTTPDYSTIAGAISALSSTGVCGPVTFNIRNGNYSGAVTIPQISGATATNSITFQSSSGDSSTVIIDNPSSTVSTNNYTFQFNGADFVSLKKVTLTRSGTGAYANVVDITNTANNNTISGCRIIGEKTTLTTANLNLINSTKFKDTGNVISGNYLKFGGYAIYLKSSGNTTYETGTKIIGNTIDSSFSYGIYLHAQKNSIVKGNLISKLGKTSAYAIYLTYLSSGNKIFNNKTNMTLGGYGLYTKYVSGTSGSPNVIYNNFIVTGDTTLSGGACYGLYLNNCYYMNAFNNSINLVTKKATTTGKGIYLTRDTTGNYGNVNIENNIITTTGGGYAFYVHLNATIKPYLNICDYNDLYTKGKYIGYYAANTTTFSAWKAASGTDAHSLNLSPTFTSSTDLHCSTSGLDGTGTPVSGVTTDIDGQNRNSSTPDIGADEFGTGIPPKQQHSQQNSGVNEPNKTQNVAEIKAWFDGNEKQAIVQLQTTETGLYTVMLMDMQGKILHQEEMKTQPGLNTTKIDMATYPQSIYVVFVSDGQKVKTIKLVDF